MKEKQKVVDGAVNTESDSRTAGDCTDSGSE